MTRDELRAVKGCGGNVSPQCIHDKGWGALTMADRCDACADILLNDSRREAGEAADELWKAAIEVAAMHDHRRYSGDNLTDLDRLLEVALKYARYKNSLLPSQRTECGQRETKGESK